MGQPRSTGKGDQLQDGTRTGSAVSVLPYKQYKEYFGHEKLAKSLATLKTYTGEKIILYGLVNPRKGRHKLPDHQ